MSQLFYKGKKREHETDEDLRTSHSEDFHGFGPEIREELSKKLKRFVGERNSSEIKVLEIGTGFARTLSFLAETLPMNRTKIWTVDPSSDVLNSAKKFLKEKSLDSNVVFVEASAEKLDNFGANDFDLVISVMVLHHVLALKPVLKEMARVVKREVGKIILVDFKPEAHTLPFTKQHEEKDFFKVHDIELEAKGLGLESEFNDHEYWYVGRLHKLN
jgi:ubiquinone/menaquinone biosynthesis C-methylase UbiE